MRRINYLIIFLIFGNFLVGENAFSLNTTVASIDPSVDFEIQLLNGTNVALSAYDGKPIILDFFATWCAPCLTQIEALKNVQTRFSSSIRIISVAVDSSDTIPMLSEFKSTYNMTWVVGLDITQQAAEIFSVTSIPTIVYFGYSGKLLHLNIGITSFSIITEWIDSDTETLVTTSDTTTTMTNNSSTERIPELTSGSGILIIIIWMIGLGCFYSRKQKNKQT